MKRCCLWQFSSTTTFAPASLLPSSLSFGFHWARPLRRKSTCCGGMNDLQPPIPNPSIVVIDKPAGLEVKKQKIKANGGLSNLQVIADFDMTLTKYLVEGRRGQSSHSLLKQGNPDCDLQRQQLFDHYYPLEVSPAIPLDEKTKLMEEWWGKTHELLVKGGLSRNAIQHSVATATIEFRDGMTQFLEILQEKCVPVLIFSAGLSDIIEEVMDQKLDQKFSNVRIVSNRMEFNSDGNLVGFIGKTIHVLNKNEHALDMVTPSSSANGLNILNEDDISALKKRTNVLLLGDHLGDLGMSDGLDFRHRISIGFLNENVEKWLNKYKEEFDIVLINDETMSYTTSLLKQLMTDTE